MFDQMNGSSLDKKYKYKNVYNKKKINLAMVE